MQYTGKTMYDVTCSAGRKTANHKTNGDMLHGKPPDGASIGRMLRGS